MEHIAHHEQVQPIQTITSLDSLIIFIASFSSPFDHRQDRMLKVVKVKIDIGEENMRLINYKSICGVSAMKFQITMTSIRFASNINSQQDFFYFFSYIHGDINWAWREWKGRWKPDFYLRYTRFDKSISGTSSKQHEKKGKYRIIIENFQDWRNKKVINFYR